MAATARRSASCWLFLPGLILQIWGSTTAFFSLGVAGCRTSSRIPPAITKLIARSPDRLDSRSIRRSPSSEPPRLRTLPSIEMLVRRGSRGRRPPKGHTLVHWRANPKRVLRQHHEENYARLGD